MKIVRVCLFIFLFLPAFGGCRPVAEIWKGPRVQRVSVLPAEISSPAVWVWMPAVIREESFFVSGVSQSFKGEACPELSSSLECLFRESAEAPTLSWNSFQALRLKAEKNVKEGKEPTPDLLRDWLNAIREPGGHRKAIAVEVEVWKDETQSQEKVIQDMVLESSTEFKQGAKELVRESKTIKDEASDLNRDCAYRIRLKMRLLNASYELGEEVYRKEVSGLLHQKLKAREIENQDLADWTLKLQQESGYLIKTSLSFDTSDLRNLLDNGDVLARDLIWAGAFRLAEERLNRVLAGVPGAPEDFGANLFHAGLLREVQGDWRGALDFYSRALVQWRNADIQQALMDMRFKLSGS